MIGRALDSIIGVLSPGAAARRVAARSMLETVKRGYDGAKSNRLNDSWRPKNQAADLELLVDADVIRARARDLVRSNAHARGVLSALNRNVVGCGIIPQARTEKDKYNDAVEEHFDRWQRQADITGRLSFYEIQRLALNEMHEAGECLIHFVRSDDPLRFLPFALEMIEADRFASDAVYARGVNPETGNEVRRGVEVDRFGAPVAYHVYERNPSDLNSYRQVIRRLPARDCQHLYRQERIGQSRGISVFAPVVIWLRNLRSYMDNELRKQAVASCFSVLIKSMGGPADAGILPAGDGPTADANGNMFDHIEPAMVARLFPNEDISVVSPPTGGAQAQVFINLIVRAIAVGTGVSYERLARDYSQTNYSSNRAADLEDRREFRPLQDLVIRQLCEPVYQRFLASLVDESARRPGAFQNIPSVDRFIARYREFTAHVWQAPGWEWVDPVKEVTADIMAIEKGLTTRSAVCAKRGDDWKEIFDQLVKEQQYAEQIKLVLSADNVIPIAAAAIEAEQAATKALEDKPQEQQAEEPANV